MTIKQAAAGVLQAITHENEATPVDRLMRWPVDRKDQARGSEAQRRAASFDLG